MAVQIAMLSEWSPIGAAGPDGGICPQSIAHVNCFAVQPAKSRL